ncbi:PEP/pyruvate-binding domain-containing protein [Desulfoplanes sp.]
MQLLKTLKRRLAGLFTRRPATARDPIDEESRAHVFKARYHAFRQLLAANNKTLELMTDMEEALQGNRPFGMSFVRSRCTAVSTNVYRIIRNLCELNPTDYQGLKTTFKEIQHRVSGHLATGGPTAGDRIILSFEEITKESADAVGSKMANLGELKNRLRLRVPEGFVVTTRGYHLLMNHQGLQDRVNCLIQATPIEPIASKDDQDNDLSKTCDMMGVKPSNLFEVCAQIQGLIAKAPVPDGLRDAILQAYDQLCEKTDSCPKVSLRSSALGEDMADTSFAGQYRSELNVERENIIQAYKDIVASKYSLRALTYRYNRGIRDEDVPMCVGCMTMVPARAGGVMYTRNPLDIRDTDVYINSVWGLAKSVVDGSVATDQLVVHKKAPYGVVGKEIRSQTQKLSCDEGEGIKREDLEEDTCLLQSVSDEEASGLARLAELIESHYGRPQDVEWSIDTSDQVFLLQSRPLKQHDVPQEPFSGTIKTPPGVEPLFTGGTTAGAGVGSGKVFIVQKDVDILLFPKDAILVSSRSLPKWASVLSKAQGVITEHGSVAGHLANVSREFGVPALFGVTGATSLLHTGQEITLDAEGRAVYPGRIETVLKDRRPHKNLMQGSPVYNTLKNVSRHILPLNLLDPDSLAFTPSSCRTYHDITRFAHEKSVQEMFDFGKANPFSPRSSKQLRAKVPMQWWIINLDNGFKEEVRGKYVDLDNIASIPMLAIWKGCVAIPWDGPPNLDGKGFMNVMMQSATNPQLNPAIASDFTNRNYFMISKHFCNLQSRFGYHFTSIEGLVGERVRENYLRFQFKGGAADYQRKVRRAEFIGEILENYDFQTRVREDAMFARMDNYEQPFLETRLIVLGYLLMHTRQLDMIMSNENVVARYRKKIVQDIEKILGIYGESKQDG